MKRQSLIKSMLLAKNTFPGVEINPTYINFFFGKNGVGKSTIANAIRDNDGLNWQAGKGPENVIVLVFNREFIKANFEKSVSVPGVFTVSEENISIQKEIAAKTAEKDKASEDSEKALAAEQEKTSELEKLETDFRDTCWNRTKDARHSFDAALGGKKGRKKDFMQAVLDQATAKEHDIVSLEKLCSTAFSASAKEYPPFKRAGISLAGIDGEDLLASEIISRSDTPFARFMKALNATDWVKNGVSRFADALSGEKLCPFCQQHLPLNFEADIAACFDDQYEDDIRRLEGFITVYSSRVNEALTILKNNMIGAYNSEPLRDYKEKIAVFEKDASHNLQILKEKRESPAKAVSLEDLSGKLAEINSLIENINKAIAENNDIVKSQDMKRQECARSVMEHIAYILKGEVTLYRRRKKELEAEIKSAKAHYGNCKTKESNLRLEISNLSSQNFDAKASMDSINTILKTTGFEGFSLHENDRGKGIYEVRRSDGSLASNLSEGELNFIAFLYFYQSVKGMTSKEDAGKDKIVVIDDPVSSMDSSALFIVSGLIRELISICQNNIELTEGGSAYVKQMFILTHNAFFHKEITYNMASHFDYVSFYLVSKSKNKSGVKLCTRKGKGMSDEEESNYNPVQNSYAALWREYEQLDSSIPLLNVIRRILEYYFLQICGYDGVSLRRKLLEENREKFCFTEENGSENLNNYHLASSMLAYVDRSSMFNDGHDFVEEYTDCGQYKTTFRMIFEVLGQIQHYNMMMSKSAVEEDVK